MSTKLLRQIKNFLFSSLKLTLLISFLISQSFLAEIYLCQNNPDAKLTNIAKAEYNNHWYDTAFLYRKQIAINHTTIQHIDPNNTNPYLSNFPLLVSINIPANKVRNDRNDIIFTNQDGTQLLNYDIENYDGSGNLIAWVQLPRLNDVNNTTDTTFYVYYDNPAYATANATASSVWDSDFKAVYHLKESGGGLQGFYY
jgi:hypothetical protein